jgi:uncharacterized Zn finger protein (UPF0148 family)
MKLLFMACPKCGAPNTSAFGVCPDCDARRVAARAAATRRVRRPQVRTKRAAA